MADPSTGVISWYSPDPRAIIPFGSYIPSRSLRRTIRKGGFHVTVNVAFSDVITACAGRPDTWISPAIIEVYTLLHRAGHAHSIESWMDGALAGGLYGVSIGGAFFGESMFSRATDASKVAFARLVHILKHNGFVLLDSQFVNDHVATLGAIEIPRSEYLQMLGKALGVQAQFSDI
jgi:leucyl/phenylalanyl-tRNA--protein transferase